MLGPLATAGRSLLGGTLHLLCPPSCWACGEPLSSGRPDFCPRCFAALTADPGLACPRCAGPVGPFANVEGGCPSCRGAALGFDRAFRFGPYRGPLRELVLEMKGRRGEALAERVAALWADHVPDGLAAAGAGMVVPVPLHWWRRWTRGYNQSEVLARALAARLRLPCRPGWLRRVRHTPKQAVLPPSARAANVRGAFRAGRLARLAGKTVLLVDDVMTTGATAGEAARALTRAGAASVVVAVLARAS